MCACDLCKTQRKQCVETLSGHLQRKSSVVVFVPTTRLDRIAPNEPTELDTRNSVAAAAGLVLFNAKRGRVCFVENFGAVKVAVGRERCRRHDVSLRILYTYTCALSSRHVTEHYNRLSIIAVSQLYHYRGCRTKHCRRVRATSWFCAYELPHDARFADCRRPGRKHKIFNFFPQ